MYMFLRRKAAAGLGCMAGAVLATILGVASAGTVTSAGAADAAANFGAAAGNPQGSECPQVLSAHEKLFNVPYHMYMTTTPAGGSKSTEGETIFAGGSIYVSVNGKWMTSPISLAEMKQHFEDNKKNVKNVSCHELREEAVNGESATVYAVHVETAHVKHDDQMWISKKGMLLRQETDNDMGTYKNHVSSRFEYNNIQAPKV